MAGKTVAELDRHIAELVLFTQVESDFFRLSPQKQFQKQINLINAWADADDNYKNAQLTNTELAYEQAIAALANVTSENGTTAIILAAKHKTINFNLTITALLDKGAKLNAYSEDNGYAAYWAVQTGNIQLVETLIARKADFTKVHDRHTPYDWAVYFAEQGYPEIKKLLQPIAQNTNNGFIVADMPYSSTNTLSDKAFESHIKQLYRLVQYKPEYFQFTEPTVANSDEFFHSNPLEIILEWQYSNQADKYLPYNVTIAKKAYDAIIKKLSETELSIYIWGVHAPDIATPPLSSIIYDLGLYLISSAIEKCQATGKPPADPNLVKRIAQMKRFMTENSSYFKEFIASDESMQASCDTVSQSTEPGNTEKDAYYKIIKALVLFERTEDEVDAKRGSVPQATLYGLNFIVSDLHSMGADINRVDADDRTALILACKASPHSVPIVRILLTFDAQLNTMDLNHSTALDYALRGSVADYSLREVIYLLENKKAKHCCSLEAVESFKKQSNVLNQAKMAKVLPSLFKNESKPSAATSSSSSEANASAHAPQNTDPQTPPVASSSSSSQTVTEGTNKVAVKIGFEKLIASLNEHDFSWEHDPEMQHYIVATQELLSKHAKPGHAGKVRCIYMLIEMANQYIYAHRYLTDTMPRQRYFAKMSEALRDYLKHENKAESSLGYVTLSVLQRLIEVDAEKFHNSSFYQAFLEYKKTSTDTDELIALEESFLLNPRSRLIRRDGMHIDLLDRMIDHRISLNHDLKNNTNPDRKEVARLTAIYISGVKEHLKGTYDGTQPAIDGDVHAALQITSVATQNRFSHFCELLAHIRPTQHAPSSAKKQNNPQTTSGAPAQREMTALGSSRPAAQGNSVKPAPTKENASTLKKPAFGTIMKERALAAVKYSNNKLFTGLFDFFLHPVIAWWSFAPRGHRSLRKLPTIIRYPVLRLWHLIRYIVGFAVRVALLPLTATVYNLSRLGMIVFNPHAYRLRAQGHRSGKTISMLIATVFTCAAILGAGFGTSLFTNPQLISALSATFGLAQGLGTLGAFATGAMILATILTVTLAISLHTAKKVAQHIRANTGLVSLMGIGATSEKYHEYYDHGHDLQQASYAPGAVLNENTLEGINTYKQEYRSLLITYYRSVKPREAISSVDRDHRQIQKLFKRVLAEFNEVGKALDDRTLTKEKYGHLAAGVKEASLRVGRTADVLDRLEVNENHLLVPTAKFRSN